MQLWMGVDAHKWMRRCLKAEPWTVCVWTVGRRFVSLEEQDPDPDPHKRDKSDPDLAASKGKEGSGSASLCFGSPNTATDFKRWERGDRISDYAGTEMPNRPVLK